MPELSNPDFWFNMRKVLKCRLLKKSTLSVKLQRPCINNVFHPGAPGFHHYSHQTSLDLCELMNCILKDCQFSSGPSELSCTASKHVQMSLINAFDDLF